MAQFFKKVLADTIPTIIQRNVLKHSDELGSDV